MHYAQILIPAICIIIFFDRKFCFYINNKITFAILCLFGLTFLAFAFSQGPFAFIGLFLPMAYYIGSNIYEPNENKIIKIIYIISLGMLIHLFLNFCIDLFVRGIDCIRRNTHLDIWTLDEYPTTQTAANYVLPIGCLYYYFVYDNKNKTKYFTYILLFIDFIYMFALGRRAPVVILFITLFIIFICDITIHKKLNKANKVMLGCISFLVFVAVFLYIIYSFDLFGLKYKLPYISVIRKFYVDGIDPKRLYLTIETIKLAPMYLFGGSHISEITGFGPHELWLDIFDKAGIIPYVIIVVISIIFLIVIIKTITNKNISSNFKLLIIGVCLSMTLEFFIEPIISGASILLLCSLIIISGIECLQVE